MYHTVFQIAHNNGIRLWIVIFFDPFFRIQVDMDDVVANLCAIACHAGFGRLTRFKVDECNQKRCGFHLCLFHKSFARICAKTNRQNVSVFFKQPHQFEAFDVIRQIAHVYWHGVFQMMF